MENARPVVNLSALSRLSNGSNPSPRRQTLLLLALLIAVASVAMIVLQRSELSLVSSDGIPLPFGAGDSVLKGSITKIGSKGVYPVTDVSFDSGETTEVLPVDTINFVLTPDSPTIAHGAPLSVALTSGKKSFGYKYTSRDAAIERANIAAATFAQRFPGQFFVSGEQRSFDTYISQFETDHGVKFLPLSDVTLDRNARSIVIANDAGTSVTTRGLLWCGDKITNGTEQCDDGNKLNGDGCNITCSIENGFSCSGQPSVCTRNPVCGNGKIEAGETCDDGNTNPADGCSAVCAVESGYVCTGQPSQCTLIVCGNGVVETGEECDDGNNINNDSCDNTCHLLAAPF